MRLAREALARIGRIELLANQLDGNQAPDLRVLRQVERTHPALSEAGHDFIAANDRGFGGSHYGTRRF